MTEQRKQQVTYSKMQANEIYINELRKREITVKIFLVTGACLGGKIEAFDNDGIIFKTARRQMLIFKNVIASIQPQKSDVFQIFKTEAPQSPRTPKEK